MNCGFSRAKGKQQLLGLNDLAPTVELLMILDEIAVETAFKYDLMNLLRSFPAPTTY
jgi:hypothetical protein